MSHPKNNHYNCVSCGKGREIEDEFSVSGQCANCGENNFLADLIARADHSSPQYKRWKLYHEASYRGFPKKWVPPPSNSISPPST